MNTTNFNNARLENISDPIFEKDGVNLRTLKRYTKSETEVEQKCLFSLSQVGEDYPEIKIFSNTLGRNIINCERFNNGFYSVLFEPQTFQGKFVHITCGTPNFIYNGLGWGSVVVAAINDSIQIQTANFVNGNFVPSDDMLNDFSIQVIVSDLVYGII
jgi:hypothetical protein